MRPIALLLALLPLLACGPDDGPAELPCVPGAQVVCPCAGGEDGVQACNLDGTAWSACACGPGGGACGDYCADVNCCDGVCVDTRNDPMNCGACGAQCPLISGCANICFKGECGCLPAG